MEFHELSCLTKQKPPTSALKYGNRLEPQHGSTSVGLKKISLSSQILSLLDKDASEDDFKNAFIGNSDQLSFTPPLRYV